jgi:hypothetical protein
MHSRLIGILALITLAAAPTHIYAQIYKTVDEDGNVVFTDVPPNRDTGAVQLDEYSTYEPAAAAPAAQTSGRSAGIEEGETEPEPSYEMISILTPRNDEPIRENSGMVSISVSTVPQLDTSAGHRVQILLNGTVMAEGGMQDFVLENVDRGSHQLTAQITNANGDILVQSAPLTFHLQRYSALFSPQNKAKP